MVIRNPHSPCPSHSRATKPRLPTVGATSFEAAIAIARRRATTPHGGSSVPTSSPVASAVSKQVESHNPNPPVGCASFVKLSHYVKQHLATRFTHSLAHARILLLVVLLLKLLYHHLHHHLLLLLLHSLARPRTHAFIHLRISRSTTTRRESQSGSGTLRFGFAPRG